MLEYSKTIGSLLGNPDPSGFMIEEPKTILKVYISMCYAVLYSITGDLDKFLHDLVKPQMFSLPCKKHFKG